MDFPQDPPRPRHPKGSFFEDVVNQTSIHLILVDASQSMEKKKQTQQDNGILTECEDTRLQDAKKTVEKIMSDFTRPRGYRPVVRCFDQELINMDFESVQAFGYTDIRRSLWQACEMLSESLKRFDGNRRKKFIRLKVTVITDAEDEKFEAPGLIRKKLKRISEDTEGQAVFIGSYLPEDSDMKEDAWASLQEALQTRGISNANGSAFEAIETEHKIEEKRSQLEETTEQNEARARDLEEKMAEVVNQPEKVLEDAVEMEATLKESTEFLQQFQESLQSRVDFDNDENDMIELIPVPEVKKSKKKSWRDSGLTEDFYNFLEEKRFGIKLGRKYGKKLKRKGITTRSAFVNMSDEMIEDVAEQLQFERFKNRVAAEREELERDRQARIREAKEKSEAQAAKLAEGNSQEMLQSIMASLNAEEEDKLETIGEQFSPDDGKPAGFEDIQYDF